MALLLGSASLLQAQPKPRHMARCASAGAVCSPGQHVAQPVVTARRPAPSSSCRYAILEVGGVRQMVEEGHDYACLSKYVQAARINNSSNDAVFHSVLGIRSDGHFTWGKPFVPHAAVKVEVLDEFQGPVPATAAEVPVDSLMTRYRVKHIVASSQSDNGQP